VFKVQDEIASAVVVALKLKLASLSQTSRQRTSNIDAYNEYLLGRQFVKRGEVGELQQSIDAYKRAIVLDPGYAAAYAGLAVSEATRADMTGEGAGLERARTAADKAIALAPTEADGYAARGYLRFAFDWDWEGARVDIEKALSLDPNDSDAQRHYGNLLLTLGSPTASVAAIKKALELDPLAARSWAALAGSLTTMGDHGGAHEALRRGLEINPESAYILENLAILQLLEGKFPEALENFRKTKFDGFRLPGTAMAEHSLGHAGESRRALDESVAKVAKESAYQIAEAFAWCGEPDKAFEWLDRAYRQRDGGLASMNADPLLVSLHAHPRYQPLLRKMNLSE
jgi:tetratricopeptide (TPR) repeat protein